MARCSKLTIFQALLIVVIVIEMIFVGMRVSDNGQPYYTYSYSYSIVLDSPAVTTGPGNITVLLNITNTGAVDGTPVVHLRVNTYGTHREQFVFHLWPLAKGGGHLNTTWRESFGLLDSDQAWVTIYVWDH